MLLSRVVWIVNPRYFVVLQSLEIVFAMFYFLLLQLCHRSPSLNAISQCPKPHSELYSLLKIITRRLFTMLYTIQYILLDTYKAFGYTMWLFEQWWQLCRLHGVYIHIILSYYPQHYYPHYQYNCMLIVFIILQHIGDVLHSKIVVNHWCHSRSESALWITFTHSAPKSLEFCVLSKHKNSPSSAAVISCYFMQSKYVITNL